MALTEEQKERIRVNRERALEIQRQRREAQAKAGASASAAVSSPPKRAIGSDRNEEEGTPDAKKKKANEKLSAKSSDSKEDEEDVILEDFEESASKWVTKGEAMKVYCLPEGTLAVCEFEEKENPHNKSWKPMKMYNRAEIRRRARKRFGGLEGLIAERQARQERRFASDLKKAGSIFK